MLSGYEQDAKVMGAGGPSTGFARHSRQARGGPVANIEWLLHAAMDTHTLQIDTRTELADEHWVATVERIELDAGLRIYLVAADILQDMVLEPRNTALKPMLSSQLSIAGDLDIEFPDGVTTRIAPDRGIFFRPLANVATYRLTGGQRIRVAGYAFDADRVERIFDGQLPGALQPLVAPERARTQVVETRSTAALRRTAGGLYARGLNGPLRILYMEGIVLQLLAAQLATIETRHGHSGRFDVSVADRAPILEARDRLLADMRAPPTLGALAAAVGLSERRLNAGFRATFGMTAFELLRNERLEHARMAINAEAVPLKAIAHRVGYNHASNFVNAYTARFGVSPRRHKRPV